MQKKLPYVVQYSSEFNESSFWRMLWPQYILNTKKLATVYHSDVYVRDPLFYAKVTAVHLQRQGKESDLEFVKKLYEFKKRFSFQMIYEADDVLFEEDIPHYHPMKQKGGNRKAIQEMIELCDQVSVSTAELKTYYLEKTGQTNIQVIPNFIPKFWMGHFYSEERILENYHKNRARPRVLFAGAPSHFYRGEEECEDDFTNIQESILHTQREFKWVFVGGYPKALTALIQKGEVEYHPWQTIDAYPAFLSSLNINVAIAPLQNNRFNRCKSCVKLLEGASLGFPVITQDFPPYEKSLYRFHTSEEMVVKIREVLQSEDLYREAIRGGRIFAETNWLETSVNIGKYASLYQK